MVHLGQHAARRADLDDGGAPAQLFPDRAHALGRAVGQPERPVVLAEVGYPRQRVTVQVAVTAGGGQDGTGRVDRRSVEQSLADWLRQVDAEAADLAHRGDARVQRVDQVTGRPGRAQRRGLLRQPRQVEHPAAHEVAVAVPQPRQHGRRAADDRARRGRRAGRRARVADPRAVDQDRGVGDRLAATRDEQPGIDLFHDPPSSSAAAGPMPAGLGPRESVALGQIRVASGVRSVRVDRND